MRWLYASVINDRLNEDNLVETNGESDVRYLLATGEFPGTNVTSPIAFLVDRTIWNVTRLFRRQFDDAWTHASPTTTWRQVAMVAKGCGSFGVRAYSG